MRNMIRSLVAVLAVTLASPALAAGGMNYTLSNAVLNKVGRQVALSLEISKVHLYSTCPTDSSTTATTNEISGNGYTAPTYAAGTGNWGAAGGGASTAGTIQNVNASAISFGTVTTSTWNVQCVGVSDGTNLLFWGPSSPQGTISVGTAVTIATNALVLSIAGLLPEVREYMLAHLGVEGRDALMIVAARHGVDLSNVTFVD